MTRTVERRRSAGTVKVVAVFAAASLVLSACVPHASEPTSPSGSPDPAFKVAPDERLQSFYDQSLQWDDCQGRMDVYAITDGASSDPAFTCTTLTVPLDYDDPTSGSIKLTAMRYSAGKQPRKPLFFNPGGPGGSAVGSLQAVATQLFPAEITQVYDIIALDPRGVGVSSPVTCLTGPEIDEERSLPGSDVVAVVRETSKRIGDLCLDRSPDMTRHSDSESAARDFDIMRAASGLERLDYVGFSYGTFLGALYADLFPSRVGRFVLDGALDPALTISEVSAGQAAGFEAALEHFFERALAAGGEVPWGSTPAEAMAGLRVWLDGLGQRPVPTSDPQRPLTQSLATNGILSLLYSESVALRALPALVDAVEGDGSMLLLYADLYADRLGDGSYRSNSFDAFNVINALDYRVSGTESEWERQAEQLTRDYPTVGSGFGLSEAALDGWPVQSHDTRRRVRAAGANPILVVGTRHDPATPYVWAESLASQLESAQLVTWEGWDHCAYRAGGSSCIVEAVNGFLLNGQLPEEGLICPAQ